MCPLIPPAESSSYRQCWTISRRDLKCFQVAFSSLCPPGHLWKQGDRDCREHFLTLCSLKIFFVLWDRNLPGMHPCSCLACCGGNFFLSHGEKKPADFWKQSWEFRSSKRLLRGCQGWVEWFIWMNLAPGNDSCDLSPGSFQHPHEGTWRTRTLISITGTEAAEGETSGTGLHSLQPMWGCKLLASPLRSSRAA